MSLDENLKKFVGSPLTDEMATADGIGRVRHFERGSIYWHPETGAHEVHGDIRAKWDSLGGASSVVSAYGSQIGYPLTDELPAADGGKVSHFQGASIYWHPARAAGYGRYSVFTSGAIYWIPEQGAYETVFSPAMLDGYRLDFCSWDPDVDGLQGCGQNAATEYCQAQGYRAADRWESEPFIGDQHPTARLRNGQVCKESFCGGFSYLRCVP
jgi:LGFP repeat